MRFLTHVLATTIGLLTITAASASIVNFDTQGITGPTQFSQATPSPRTVQVLADGITVTFSGGVVLTNATSLPADRTSIYGTANFGQNLLNPLSISFSQPVQNVVLDVINGNASTQLFTVADNMNDSQSFTLVSNGQSGAATIGLLGTDSLFTITQPNAINGFDFFIDNIQFNVNAKCGTSDCTTIPSDPGTVPEPATLPLIGLAILGLGMARRSMRS